MGKGDITRQAILDRATAVASQAGLEGLTIGKLAEELELSKSGLFAHFGSKESLQVAVLENAAEHFVEIVVKPALKAPRGEPRLRALFEHWSLWPKKSRLPGGCVFVAAGVELDDRPGPARDTLVKQQRDFLSLIATTAEERDRRRPVPQGPRRRAVRARLLRRDARLPPRVPPPPRPARRKARPARVRGPRGRGPTPALTRTSNRKECAMAPAAKKSTNDRSSFLRSALPGALRLLSRISPTLAAEAVSRLFLRVPHVQRPRGEAAAFLASGEDVHRRVRGFVSGGLELGPRPGRPPRPRLGRARRADARIRAWPSSTRATGPSSSTRPAHGESAGRSTSLPGVRRGDHGGRARRGRPRRDRALDGRGLHAPRARARPLPFACVVLAAPSGAERIWDEYAFALGLPEEVAAEARRRLEERVGTRFAELGVAHLAPRIATPVLVVHDLDDEEIPWDAGDEIARALSAGRLETTRGLGHRRILRDGASSRAPSPSSRRTCRRRGARAAGARSGRTGTEDFCGTCALGRELFERERRFAA